MKAVFVAESGLQAHLVLHQLQQAGIDAEIRGELLQGAIGELPAAGNVRVYVDERDVTAAKQVIEDWERS